MMMRYVVLIPLLFVAPVTLAFANDRDSTGKKSGLPNFVIIFTDDQGYQDLGCFGSHNIRTINGIVLTLVLLIAAASVQHRAWN